eukprot:6670495-Prymnesium_polylepis.1
MWLGLLGALLYAGYAMYTLDASGYESDDENEDGDDEVAEQLYRATVAAKKEGAGWARKSRVADKDFSKLSAQQAARTHKEIKRLKK